MIGGPWIGSAEGRRPMSRFGEVAGQLARAVVDVDGDRDDAELGGAGGDAVVHGEAEDDEEDAPAGEAFEQFPALSGREPEGGHAPDPAGIGDLAEHFDGGADDRVPDVDEGDGAAAGGGFAFEGDLDRVADRETIDEAPGPIAFALARLPWPCGRRRARRGRARAGGPRAGARGSSRDPDRPVSTSHLRTTASASAAET